MKKILFMSIIALLIVPNTFAGQPDTQQYDHLLFSQEEPFYGSQFVKRIENNLLDYGMKMRRMPDNALSLDYNLDSKREKERLFFGDFNAKIEYFFDESYSEPLGLRIFRDSLDKAYILEVKRIPNFDEVNKMLENKYPPIGFTSNTVTKRIINKSGAHNREMWAKQREESLKLYLPETHQLTVSDIFAERLYGMIVTLIDNYDSKVKNQPSEFHSVTFRCVVENEVWTLLIDDIPGGDAFTVSNIFMDIIKDAKAGATKLDEAEYMKLLDDLGL